MTDASKSRAIKNEQLIRKHNGAVGSSIQQYFRNDPHLQDAPIAFACECSNLDCEELINLSIDMYAKLHKRKDHFTVHQGHVTSTIERVVSQQDDFEVVEKFALAKA